MRQRVSAATAFLIGLAGVSAVVFGAFGAHALRGTIDEAALATWHTGVEYHFWHALALLVAATGLPQGRGRTVAMTLFGLGIVLFSGSLCALALGAPRMVGVITPVGGVAFIAAWIGLAASLRQERR